MSSSSVSEAWPVVCSLFLTLHFMVFLSWASSHLVFLPFCHRFSSLFSADSPTSDSAKSKVSVRLCRPAEASVESMVSPCLFLCPLISLAGFLGFSEGSVHPRPPGFLHFCCSQPQKEEVKGETAAQQLRRRPRLCVPQEGDPRPEAQHPPPPPD